MGKLNLPYMDEQDLESFVFYQIPKILIEDDEFKSLDYGAKLLYGIMIDRAKCSKIQNGNFTDKFGHVYIIFTIEEIMTVMQCSANTAVKMVKQLDEKGLIIKTRRGQGKPTLIYVMKFSSYKYQNVKLLNRKRSNSGIPKNEKQELENMICSNTDRNKTNGSKNNSIHPSPPCRTDGTDMTEAQLKKAVKEEILERRELPVNYIKDKPKLTTAIRFMTEWDLFSHGYQNDHQQFAYNLCVDALIRMCHGRPMTLNGDEVGPEEIIEKINRSAIFGPDYIDLTGITNLAIEKYLLGEQETGIRTSKINYMAACIYDAITTGQISQYEAF